MKVLLSLLQKPTSGGMSLTYQSAQNPEWTTNVLEVCREYVHSEICEVP